MQAYRKDTKELRTLQIKRPHLTASTVSQAPPLYQMNLTFERPLEDLKRTIEPLTERLSARGYRLLTAA